ncbi:MAG: hypothetical protein A2V66_10790 [Ignavibacteria bacterium RBG_13_36_8]|nr:MAG: hypothetical protein A2V66_10790 [Ignavibacteria bacterium RBG_13_36_8]
MYDEKLQLPITVGNIKDPQIYYKAPHGSQLRFTIYEEGKNLVARGIGCSWNENPQIQPIMEWNHRYCVEIVKGAMPPGQLQIQTMFFLHLNDSLPTLRSLTSLSELTAIVQIGEHEDPRLRGLVIEAFKGCVIGGQSGNWNAQSTYLRQAQSWFRIRMTGLEWLAENPGLANAADNRAGYPAEIEG